MKYKLIATDIDGTLVNDKSELTERTKNAIIKAIKMGVIFVPASGRPLINMRFLSTLFDEDMPFIVYNGAAAYMSKSQKLLFTNYLDFDLAKEVFEIGLKRDIPQALWVGPRLWVSKICDETLWYKNLANSIDLTVTKDLDDLKDESKNIFKLLWLETHENVLKLQREMKEYFHGRLNCHCSLPLVLEFVSLSAEKGASMAEIGKLYGIDRSQMIAVGDSYNDVSMLKYAGFSVAVENAHDDIKDICDHITLSNNNDGVAAVIEEFILGSI